MPAASSPAPSREQRVTRLGRRLGTLGASLAAIAALAMLIGAQGQGEVHSFLRGFGTGILTALPLFFAGMMWRTYRVMDEYARVQLTQGASVAFLVTMIVSGGLIALQAWLHFPTPAWLFYGLGMTAWLVATLVQNARLNRGDRA